MNSRSIFISYGRQPESYVKVIFRIKDDLERHGHRVWIDTNELRCTVDW
jgi:hypothetical protein